MQFQKLLEPGRIGKLEIKNRIVMAAMASVSAAHEGFATELTKDYYEARAKGGVGLITVGSLSVDYPVGISGKPRLTIHEDKFIPALTQVIEVIHKYGAKAAAQLHHAGNASLQNLTGVQPVAPSPILRRTNYQRPIYFMPRELSVSEIADIVAKFAKAAERAQEAGFDGVEIHAGHRYLLSTFLSPYWNRRQDKYGGDLKNRARFLLEVISTVREVVGHDYPLWCRINGKETDVEGGITLEMAKEVAKMLQSAGVDAIHVSIYDTSPPACPSGYAIDLAAEVKKVINVPVIAVGRIDHKLGDKALRQKKADFIAIARALIADPDLPNKVASGRLDDIRPCMYCNSCLSAPIELQMREGLRECAVNAELTKEREYAIKPAAESKKVLIIGGGPAGMEAARVAKLRGHQVVLYEKEPRLGGQLKLASILRQENEALNKYLSTQIKKLGVKIELGKEVNSTIIDEIKPDAIVLATGATPVLPNIPGIDRDNVLSGADIRDMMNGRLRRVNGNKKFRLRRALWYLGSRLMRIPFGPSAMRWLLNFWVPLGGKIIVVGKGLAGIELADFLVERGKQVTIVDTCEDLPFGEPPMPVLRQFMESKLIERGTAMLAVAEYEWITDRGLTIINKKGQRQTIEGDTIVFAAEHRPNAELYQKLSGKHYQVHLAGDCAEPCGILEAIRSGSRIGHVI
ncbi:FAD-dependent oxidoreductase [Chloroflexota bacterium]